VLGYFGRTPVPPDPDVVKIAEEQMGKPRFDGNPLEIIEPGIPAAKKILENEGLPVTEENIFIVGALATPGGNKGLEFLKGNFSVNIRKGETSKPPSQDSAAQKEDAFTVTVDGRDYAVRIREGIADSDSEAKPPSQPPSGESPPVSGDVTPLAAAVPGNVYKIEVSVGDKVEENQPLVVLEAMKMETAAVAPCSGVVASVEVSPGDVVETGQVLLTIAPG